MERLLKSIIVTKEQSKQDLLRENLSFLVTSKLVFSGIDQEIFTFIFTYEDKFGEVPTLQTIRDTFEKESRLEILARLESVEKSTSYVKSGFQKLTEDFFAEQQEKNFGVLLKESAAIATQGLRFGKHEIRKGVREAARYFLESADQFLLVGVGTKTEGNIREDGDEVIDEYMIKKADPTKGVGQLMGIEKIDKNFRGTRRGELFLVAGHYGEYKSTICVNYAYNQAVKYGWNSIFFSLEMQYAHIRRMLYAIHSAHLRFKDIHPPLNYEKIRDGLLDDEEEHFFKIVVSDFKKNSNYGHIYVVQPDDDVTITDIKAKAEFINRKIGIQTIFIDYLGLVESERRYGDFTLDLNFVLKRAKKMATYFDNGQGIAVVSPFQTNRKGRTEAEKNDLVYKTDCLSYANEAERSADVIIWSIVNEDMRGNNEIKIGNLKARDHQLLKPFMVRICPLSRKITNLIEVTSGEIEEGVLNE